ncbi:hypothetical protein ACLJK8_03805 [Amaricoccus sp. W119]
MLTPISCADEIVAMVTMIDAAKQTRFKTSLPIFDFSSADSRPRSLGYGSQSGSGKDWLDQI